MKDTAESSAGSRHLAVYLMKNYLYALSKKSAFFHPCSPAMGLSEHTVPLFPNRTSDGDAIWDSGCACQEQVLVRKVSGAAVVLQVVS